MKKMISGLTQVVLLTMLCKILATQPCGSVNVLNSEVELDRSSFVLGQQDLAQSLNGSQLTVSGWIMLTNEERSLHPLLQLSSLENEGEEDFPETLTPFLSLYYDNTDNEGADLLKIEVAKSEDEFELVEESVTLNLNEWLFIVYSANYSQDRVTVSISSRNGFNFIKNISVDFKAFSLRQNLEIDIGCTPDDRTLPDAINSCLIGRARDFSLVLDSFSDTSMLYVLADGSEQQNITFLFDSFDKTEAERVSIDSSKTPYTISGEGEPNAATVGFAQNKSLVMEDVARINASQLSSSPTTFLRFMYSEPLPDNFLLMYLRDDSGVLVMEIRLIVEEDKRAVEVHLMNTNVRLVGETLLSQNIANQISVSLIHRANQSALLLKVGEETIVSDFVDNELEGSFKAIFFRNEQPFEGKFQLIQANFLNNAGGIVYSAKRESNQVREARCASNCALYSSINQNSLSCLSCQNNQFVNRNNQQCSSFCPFGTYNFSGSCFTCRRSICDKFKQNFFKTDQISRNRVLMTQINDLQGFDHGYAENFTVDVEDATLNQDYDFSVQSFPQNKSAIFDVNALNNANLTDKEMSIRVRDDSNLADVNGNLLRNSRPFTFPIRPIIAIDPNTEVADVDNGSESGDSESSESDESDEIYGRIQRIKRDDAIEAKNRLDREVRRDDDVEDSFETAGIFGFIFMVIAMFAGLLGTLLCCPYTDEPMFFYQKWIQTFIMFQYVTFWTFYNAYLPYNLLSYLNGLFKYSVGWHDIFNNRAKDNHDDDPLFVNKLHKYTLRRFYQEGVENHFVLSFGFPLLITLIGLFIYLIVKILAVVMRKKKTTAVNEINPRSDQIHVSNHVVTQSPRGSFMEGCMETLLYKFEWKLIFTLFLIFIVEATVFICYNFYGASFEFKLYTFSFVFAIIWAVVILILVFYVLFYPAKSGVELAKSVNTRRHRFITEGLTHLSPAKFFQGIQYLHYLLFAVVLVFAYKSRLTQIIITGLLLLFFVIYVIGVRPPESKFDKIEQVICHLILLLAFIFLFILVVDDSAEHMDGDERWVLGYFVMILTLILFFWNMCIMIYKLITYILTCMRNKKQRFSTMRPDVEGMDRVEENVSLTKPDNYNYNIDYRDQRDHVIVENKPISGVIGIDNIVNNSRPLNDNKFVSFGDKIEKPVTTTRFENNRVTSIPPNLTSDVDESKNPTRIVNVTDNAEMVRNSRRVESLVMSNPPVQREKLETLSKLDNIRRTEVRNTSHLQPDIDMSKANISQREQYISRQ